MRRMRKQCCAGCGSAIGLKQYYKALSYAVTCDKCGQRHGVKPGSRWAVALLIGVVPIVNVMVTEWYDPNRAWYVPLVMLYIAVIYALLPWLLRIVPEDRRSGSREQREFRG
jgi:CXXC-20-CXXC protein